MKLSRVEGLSEKEIIEIDSVSMEILEETGVKVLSEEVLKIYESGGAKVNYDSMIVKIPEKLIRRCLNSAPSEYKLYNRDADSFLDFGNNLGYCVSGHNAIYTLDTETMERRPSTKEEIGNFAKISDALPNIHIVGVQAMPQDVFSKSSILHAVEAVANNTSKHIFFSPENVGEAKALIEMLKVINGGENLGKFPIATCQLSPISPLTWSKGTAEAVVEIAKSGLPLCILPQPYCGVTSPITLAGTLTTNNIEEISALVLAQIVNEGSPFTYGAAWTTFEMKTGAVLIGTPERNLLSVGGAQIARYYNLPSHCIAFDTDSNIYDEQNGFEKIFTIIATLQSGINMIVNAGMFSTGMTVSYEQLIVDHEIASFVYRYLEGITVNKDTIAKEVIQNVGQHNDYMAEPHTMKYVRLGEHAPYKVSNRDVYDNWKSSGKPSVTDNAREVAEEIIKEHKPKLLDKDKIERLKDVIAGYEAKFKK